MTPVVEGYKYMELPDVPRWMGHRQKAALRALRWVHANSITEVVARCSVQDRREGWDDTYYKAIHKALWSLQERKFVRFSQPFNQCEIRCELTQDGKMMARAVLLEKENDPWEKFQREKRERLQQS